MEFLSFELSTKSLSLKKGPIPKPINDEVLIRVAYSGVCGTDLHILEGSFPCKSDGSLILGHEFAGTVQAVGPSTTTIKVGQRVAVDPNSGCGNCKFCHNGKYHLCISGGINSTVGIFRNGGWATHAVVPETQVHLLPDDVEFPQAALTEPLSCLAHGWDILDPITVGTRILVIGAGIIGLLWASVLHLQGHRKSVTVSEVQEKRKEMAKNLNLDYEVVSPSELKDSVFDLAIDCSGFGPAIESAISLLDHGGRLCIFGVSSPQTKISIEPFNIYKKELSILGVNINPFTFRKGLELVRAMGKSYLEYNKLGIKVYKLSEYKEALKALKEGSMSKVVFKL